MNVLITSSGSTNGINIIRALEGRVRIITTDSNELSAGLYMSDKFYVVPKAIDEKFKETIIDICRRENIDIIFPSHSEEISVFNKITELSDKLVLSPPKVYEMTQNKILCKAFLNSIDVLTPYKYPKEFPMIIKPIIGTGSKSTIKINNQKELDFYNIKDTFYEEFIEGTEYTVIGVSDFDGKMICALPTIRIEKKGGLAVKSKTEKNYELVSMVKNIVENMGLVGVWNVQCIKNGKYYFIDINNRFPSGSMPLATASGMNIPVILIYILKGKTVEPNLVYGKTSLRFYDSIII